MRNTSSDVELRSSARAPFEKRRAQAEKSGNDVRTSFHSGAAISTKARGIVTSTPDPGSLTKVIADAHAAGIPVILMNTEDKTSGRDAYVGGDLVAIGHRYAQYLVDHNFVKKGDF